MTYDDFMREQLGEWYVPLDRVIHEKSFVSFMTKNKKHEKLITPEVKDIFRAYRETPLSKVKVVLLGMDPYIDGQATGLSFMTKGKQNLSLRLITQELGYEPDMTAWPGKGVLMINVALTVKLGGPSGKFIKNWYPFTQEVFKTLREEAMKREVVFILLGAHAAKYKKFITSAKHESREADFYEELRKAKVEIRGAAHTAAHRFNSNAGFLGSGVFKGLESVLVAKKG